MTQSQPKPMNHSRKLPAALSGYNLSTNWKIWRRFGVGPVHMEYLLQDVFEGDISSSLWQNYLCVNGTLVFWN